MNTKKMILFDLISYVLAVLPPLLAWSFSFWVYYTLYIKIEEIFVLALAALFFPLILILIYCSTIRLLFLIIPSLKPGIYRASKDKEVLVWLAHLAINRSQKISGFLYLIRGINLFKFLVYKSLGSYISYDFRAPMEFTLVDLPLITIEKGVFIGENVHISCHYFQNDRLYLKPVHIGENVFIGMNSIIGPGSVIGKNSWVGFRNIIKGEKLADNSKVKDLEWERGKPKL